MKKKLFEILPIGFDTVISGSQEIEISGINLDSRLIKEGDVFAAFKGVHVDGHAYIDSAIEKGAVCVVCEKCNDKKEGITYIETEDPQSLIGEMLSAFNDYPTDSIRLVGVTGTNGKTTVATLLYQLMSGLGYHCGLISTVENRIGNQIVEARYTTPDVVSLHALMSQMRDEGCEFVFMEVSSHAAHQKRIAGLKFEGAIFTNLTLDHLDYHGTMLNYINAKKMFFDGLERSSFALVNTDDRNGLVMLQNTIARKKTYGLKSMADYKVKIIENTVHGLHLKINSKEAIFRLIGEFNAYNIAAVYGAISELGINQDEALALMSGLRGAEGRFDQVYSKDGSKIGIVDYAHTPDALENVLTTVSKVKSKESRVISVVGCGGDRDTTKRPIMAKVASNNSDLVVLTSDNPRSEDPEVILDQMEAGLDNEQKKSVVRITDRKEAIKTAVMLSKIGDIIVVTGKGHENYQEIKGEKFPFNDKKILEEYLD